MSELAIRPCPVCSGRCDLAFVGDDFVVYCTACRYPYFKVGDDPSYNAKARAVAQHNALAVPVTATLREVELRHVVRVLRHAGFNHTKATRMLGIGRTTLYRWRREIDRGGS